MSFDFRVVENVIYAKIDGEVDMEVSGLWREALEQQLKTNFARNLVFDFTNVTFIDSSGLGVVLGRYKRVVSRGGKVKIIGANSQVYKILQLSGFLRLMDVENPKVTCEKNIVGGWR